MNKLQYYLFCKHHGKEVLEESYMEELYSYFMKLDSDLRNITLSKNDFFDIITCIYDVLRFNLNDEEFHRVILRYIQLIMADIVDGNVVDVKWFINHVWYMSTNQVDGFDYQDSILFIQNKLVKQFDIRESFKEKVYRKTSTAYLTNLLR